MNELLKSIIKNIEGSYFYDLDQNAGTRVIVHVKGLLATKDKKEIIAELSKRKTEPTAEWNLYAIAWRTIEKSIEYTFKAGDQIVFNNRIKTIKAIDIEKRAAVVDTGTYVPLVYIKKAKDNVDKAKVFKQLSLF